MPPIYTINTELIYFIKGYDRTASSKKGRANSHLEGKN